MDFRTKDKLFQIVDASLPEDRKLWLECWNQWPSREVHAHPSYVELFCDSGHRALAAIYQGDQSGILLPLVARPLAAQPWLSPNDERWDLITPYGYGGPFQWGQPDGKLFWRQLDTWAQRRNIVGLTARLSLFESQLLPFEGPVNTPMMNVVRSLTPTTEEIWASYASKVRKNVRKARANGLRVEVDETGSQLDDFLAIYYETMKRRDAADGFYFPKEFFSTITSELKGQFAIFHVLHDTRIISTELVLLSATTMYSFLGGTDSEFFSLRPNDLLKHEIIEWGKNRGMHSFVLGGGYGYEDGIYKYKLAFAPNGSVPFKVGYHSFLPAEEQLLLQTRQSFALSSGQEWLPRDNFFPQYRS